MISKFKYLLLSEMYVSGTEIEADQLINELVPLLKHSDTYEYVILVLVVCLAIDKLIKKIQTYHRLCQKKHEMNFDNGLPST